MSYPQPSSDVYAKNGYKFFRLHTPLVSGGDIYESAQSGQAFAIGPESDISRVRVTYYDAEADNFANQVICGTDRAFVGRLDANLASTYIPANRKGRVLIAPDNLWDPDLTPDGILSPANHTIIVIPPTLDIIEYFGDPAGVVAGRNDKIYRFPRLPWKTHGGNAQSSFLLIPFYGRRFLSYSVSFPILLEDTVTQVDLAGYNLNYGNHDSVISQSVPLESNATPIDGTSAGAYTGTYSIGQTPAGAGFGTGMFDYIQLAITPHATLADTTVGPFVTVTVSDTPVSA